MISLRRRPPDSCPPVEPRLFREAMSRPAVARVLFLPLDQAWWDGDRFTLGKWTSSAPRPSQRGVRLQECHSNGHGPPAERDTQGDLCTLIDSVTELRRTRELAGLVLSDETMIGEQSGALAGKRVLFGLNRPAQIRFQEDTPAAAECHRAILRTVKRAGFILEHPKEPFNPTTGFGGLHDWAAAVRLRRKPSRKPWLLLLLLPLLLLPWECMSHLRNRPSASDQTNNSLDKSGDSGKAPPGDGAGGAGKAAAGGAGGGGQKGKGDGGNPNPKGGNPPPGQPQPKRPARVNELAGPPTTIPSKLKAQPPEDESILQRMYRGMKEAHKNDPPPR
jgi:hypothetical protein